jgi:hypothetical protein
MKNYKQPLLTIFVIFAAAYVLTILGCNKSAGTSSGVSNSKEVNPQSVPEALAQGTDDQGSHSDQGSKDQNQQTLLDPVDGSKLPLCTATEFKQLLSWRKNLDAAVANINLISLPALQNDDLVARWKYDTQAVQSSQLATKSCEEVIAYHKVNPCKREKFYTEVYLKQQCFMARTYYYRFAQHTDSLIVKNATLLLNTDFLKNRIYEPGPSDLSYGQCVLTNITDKSIQFKTSKAIVTESQVLTGPGQQMYTMLVQPGLKFECYGLVYTSVATSLSEVIRLLSAKDTVLPLSYELK